MPSSNTPGPRRPRDQGEAVETRSEGAPGPVRFLALLVGLEGAALVVFGLVQTFEGIFGTRTLPLGAVILLALLYIGYGLWLCLAAAALLRARIWPRALVVMSQVFLVLISWQSRAFWGWPATILLIVYGLVVVALLFSRTTSAHLAPERFSDRPRR